MRNRSQMRNAPLAGMPTCLQCAPAPTAGSRAGSCFPAPAALTSPVSNAFTGARSKSTLSKTSGTDPRGVAQEVNQSRQPPRLPLLEDLTAQGLRAPPPQSHLFATLGAVSAQEEDGQRGPFRPSVKGPFGGGGLWSQFRGSNRDFTLDSRTLLPPRLYSTMTRIWRSPKMTERTASLKTLLALPFGGEGVLRRPPRPRPAPRPMASVLCSFPTFLAMTETITQVDSVGQARCVNSKMA